MTKTPLDHYQEAPGHRILRPGDRVKVTGLRGLWTIKSFTKLEEVETIEVTVVGGLKKEFRTVTVDRIGTRKETAGR